MAVASLAFDELSPSQQQRLADLLRQLPDLKPIQSGFPTGAISDRDLVMAAATWPDLIKQISRPKEEPRIPGTYFNKGYIEALASIADIDYGDLMHKGWHFKGLPYWVGPGPSPKNLKKPEAVNAASVVASLVKQMRVNEPASKKAYQVVWLLHLVGDLHQPLHAAEGCSPTYPKGDTGGNNVLISAEKKKDALGKLIEIPEAKGETELHAFWDDVLGKKTKGVHLDSDIVTATSIAALAKSKSLGANGDESDPDVWAKDSHDLAVSDAYKPLTLKVTTVQKKITKKDRTVVIKNIQVIKATITKKYADHAHELALRQVKLAGHRLAILLKAIL